MKIRKQTDFICERCNSKFLANGGRAKYCFDCKVDVKNERDMKRYKAKKKRSGLT